MGDLCGSICVSQESWQSVLICWKEQRLALHLSKSWVGVPTALGMAIGSSRVKPVLEE